MRRRKWLLIGGAAAGGLLLLAVLFIFVFYGRVGAWYIDSKVRPRLEARFDRAIEIGEIDVGRGRAVLRDIEVRGELDGAEPLARIDKIVVNFSFWASLVGSARLGQVTLSGVDARIVRFSDGTTSVADLVARLRERERDDSDSGGSGRRPSSVRVVDASLSIDDQSSGFEFHATGLSSIMNADPQLTMAIDEIAADTGYGQKVALRSVVVNAQKDDLLGSANADIGDGEVALWKGMTLTGVSGVVRQGERAGQLLIDLAGGYGGAQGELWTARGSVTPTEKRGDLTINADRFTLDRIGAVLEDSLVIDYEATSIDVAIDIQYLDGVATVDGDVEISDLNVFHEWVAPEPIRDIDLAASLEASLDVRGRLLSIESGSARLRGVDYVFDGEVALARGVTDEGPLRSHPRVRGHLVIPEVSCQTMLESIPKEFIPKLQGFELEGDFDTDLEVVIDWSDLELTEINGYVGINGCKVEDVPEAFDAELLAQTFEHETLVGPDEWETVVIGMESIDFAPIWDVSPYLLKAFMTTEDSRFYDHRGFIVREFRTALIKDLEAGYFRYGASSITMQMVKNVFLSREKTLSRKLQELFLVWYVEQVLTKDRIFEIYINAIEYGPALYGIKPAAELYFDKHPRELVPQEAAFMASLLPAPRRRYWQYCKGKPTGWTERKVERVLKLMVKRDRLTEEELEEALDTPLEFNPVKDKDLCKKRIDW